MSFRPIIRQEFGKLITETPFSAAWVDAIKQIIPQGRRKYGNKVWEIDLQYYTCVKAITEHIFGSGYIDSTGGVSAPQTSEWKERWDVWKETERKSEYQQKNYYEKKETCEHGFPAKTCIFCTIDQKANQQRSRQEPPRNRAGGSSHHDTLFVTPNAPKEVITAAWRALCSTHHPDKGGSLESMQKINEAYNALKKQGKV
jgi:hypothetical protein